jgi:hypothetical protein
MDLPTDLTDQLKAVNVLLQAISESPVNSLEDNESVDKDSALAVLDEVDLAVQSEGWAFNREYAWPLTRNSDGSLVLPRQTLSFVQGDGFTAKRVVERNKMVYNQIDHTFTWPAGTYTADLVVRVGWEEMWEVARRYITIRAAQLFQGRVQGASVVAQISQPEVQLARQVLEQYEDRTATHNQLAASPSVLRTIFGRGVRRR